MAAPMSLSRLDPTFVIGGERFTAIPQDMAGIDRNHLSAQVCDLSDYRSEIIAAVDFVFSGV